MRRGTTRNLLRLSSEMSSGPGGGPLDVCGDIFKSRPGNAELLDDSSRGAGLTASIPVAQEYEAASLTRRLFCTPDHRKKTATPDPVDHAGKSRHGL